MPDKMIYCEDIVLALAKKYFKHDFDKEGAMSGEKWEKRTWFNFSDVKKLLPKLKRREFPRLGGYYYMYNKNEMFIRVCWLHEGHECNPKYIAYMEDGEMKCEDV